MSTTPRPFVSVKFSPIGRTYSFLIPELALDEPPKTGDQVVVQIATDRMARSGGQTAMTVTAQQLEDGVSVQVGATGSQPLPSLQRT